MSGYNNGEALDEILKLGREFSDPDATEVGAPKPFKPEDQPRHRRIEKAARMVAATAQLPLRACLFVTEAKTYEAEMQRRESFEMWETVEIAAVGKVPQLVTNDPIVDQPTVNLGESRADPKAKIIRTSGQETIRDLAMSQGRWPICVAYSLLGALRILHARRTKHDDPLLPDVPLKPILQMIKKATDPVRWASVGGGLYSNEIRQLFIGSWEQDQQFHDEYEVEELVDFFKGEKEAIPGHNDNIPRQRIQKFMQRLDEGWVLNLGVNASDYYFDRELGNAFSNMGHQISVINYRMFDDGRVDFQVLDPINKELMWVAAEHLSRCMRTRPEGSDELAPIAIRNRPQKIAA